MSAWLSRYVPVTKHSRRVLCEKAKAAKAEHDHIMHSTRSIQGQCNQANQALEEQERAIADLQTKTQGLEQRSAQQKANLEKAKASLQKLQAEVDALPPVENHAAELAAIDQQMRELEDLVGSHGSHVACCLFCCVFCGSSLYNFVKLLQRRYHWI